MTLAKRISAFLKAEAKKLDAGVGLHEWIGGIAYECEVSDETMANWYRGDNTPGGEGLVALLDHFGPPLTNIILEPTGQVAAYAEDVTAVQDANELVNAKQKIKAALKALSDGGTVKLVAGGEG